MKCTNSNFKSHLKLEFVSPQKHFVTVTYNKLITFSSKQTIKTLNHRSLKTTIKTTHKISLQVFFHNGKIYFTYRPTSTTIFAYLSYI